MWLDRDCWEIYSRSAARVMFSSSATIKVGDINKQYLGVLRVGISHTCGLALLPDILPLFEEQYPDVQVVLHEAPVPELGALAAWR